jgi:hypothetical protein
MPDVELPDDVRKEIQKYAAEKQISYEWLVDLYRRGFNAKIGATGQFPFGKMRPDDQGELAIAMGTDVKNGVVRMEFGKPVAWLALPASQARQLANLLLEKAAELEKHLH